MVKAKNDKESITLTLPVSIILNSLNKHEGRIGLQNERLPEAVAVVAELKAERYPDSDSIKAAQERVRIWTREWRWYNLLKDLASRIEANPYPGQHWRLYALAQRLMPEVSRREWHEIFFWFGITNVVVHTPVEVAELDIIAVEQELLALLAEGQPLLPSSLEGVLRCSPGSRQYRVAKRGLEERGWRWARRRQPPTTVMVPPPRSPEPAGAA
jgi:hypothetical protein